jgi:hypothetical protein
MSLSTANHPDWYDERGEPPLVLRALALHAFARHGYGAGIPIWFQKVLFAALTPIALLQGYRLAVPPLKSLSSVPPAEDKIAAFRHNTTGNRWPR